MGVCVCCFMMNTNNTKHIHSDKPENIKTGNYSFKTLEPNILLPKSFVEYLYP